MGRKAPLGAVDGGPSAAADLANAVTDAWYRACTKAGSTIYPYGATYVPARCNDLAYDAGGTIPVASLPGCVGGYPGLYDMLGNAVEWVDACDSNAGPNDNCYIRASAYDDGNVDCTGSTPQSRDSADATKGFRCCSP